MSILKTPAILSKVLPSPNLSDIKKGDITNIENPLSKKVSFRENGL